MSMRRLRDEVGEPTVVDRHPDGGELGALHRLGLGEAGGDERDGLHVHRAVEDDTGRDAVVVVVGEASCRVVVAGGAEVGVVEIAAAAQQRGGVGLVLRRRPGEPVEVIEVLRRAVGTEVLDETRADVGVVGHDDNGLVAVVLGRCVG